jgi:hypothetical protein
MQEQFLHAFSSLTHADISFLLALLAIVFLLGLVIRLEMRINRLLVSGKPANLEDSLQFLRDKSREYQAFRTDLEKYLVGVERRLRQSLQGFGLVRFNPFKGSGGGGNQSFASAFINEHGNGIVVSTIYSRDHVSMFAKPLSKFSSEFELTAEEKDAILRAKEELSK